MKDVADDAHALTSPSFSSAATSTVAMRDTLSTHSRRPGMPEAMSGNLFAAHPLPEGRGQIPARILTEVALERPQVRIGVWRLPPYLGPHLASAESGPAEPAGLSAYADPVLLN